MDALFFIAHVFLFQSTPLREGRLRKLVIDDNRGVVSIHAPARGATATFACIYFACAPFQSTPLREGRRCGGELLGCRSEFQSTPLREGRHNKYLHLVGNICVSIHAPARGATHVVVRHHGEYPVSIHAPARGATTTSSAPMRARSRFNPRPCARGDDGGVSP